MLALLVALVVRLAGRHRPHLAYLLWLLVVIKCLTPPLWSSPAGVFSWALLRVEAAPVAEKLTKVVEETKPQPPTVIEETKPRFSVDGKLMDEGMFADDLLQEPAWAAGPAATEEVSPQTFLPDETESQSLHPAWTILATVWMFGVLVLAAVVAVQWVRVWRIVCRATTVTDETLLGIIARLRRQLGVRGGMRLKATSEPIGPAVFGLFRPVLLLPEQLLQRCSTDQIEPILAHELMHIRRRDPLVAVLQVASQTLWWFHPLVWWANRRITQERERCCDEQVLAHLDCPPAHYAHVLLDVLQENVRQRPVFVLPAAGGRQITSNRLEHIMKRAQKFHRRTPLWCWVSALLVAVVVLPGAGLILEAGVVESEDGVLSQDEPKEETKPSSSGHGAALGPVIGLALNAAIDEIVKKFELNDALQLQLLGFAIDQPGDEAKSSVLSIVLFLPEKNGAARVQRFEMRNPDQDFTLRMVKIRSPATSDPVAVITYAHTLQGRTLSREKIAVFDAKKGWLEKRVKVVPEKARALLDRLNPWDQEIKQAGIHIEIKSVKRDKNGFPLVTIDIVNNTNRSQSIVIHPNYLTVHLDNYVTSGPIGSFAGKQVTIKKHEKYSVTQSPAFWLADAKTLKLADAKLKSGRHEIWVSYKIGDATIESKKQTFVVDSHEPQKEATERPQAAKTREPSKEREEQAIAAIRKQGGTFELVRNKAIIMFSGRAATDEGMEHLKALTSLQRLDIDSPNVTDACLMNLKGLTQLQVLNLYGPQFTDAGLKHLEGLTKLHSLTLHNTNVTDAGLEHLEGLKSLRQLDLTGTQITDAGLEHCKPLAQLENLNLGGTKITDAGLKHLRRLPQLKHLWLHKTQVTDVGLKDLKGFANLQDLGLGNTNVTGAGLEHLSGLKSLRSLLLSGPNITDAALEHLKGLTQLKHLYVSNTKVTGAGLIHLKELTNLQTLSLQQTAITDDALKHLKGMTDLSDLDISITKITDAGLEHLKGMTKLKRLSLFETNVTDAGLQHLKGLTNLQSLHLTHTFVTASGVFKLRQALPKCKISH